MPDYSRLLSMSIANSFITDWDAKFYYNFWRPVTAIRNGDKDGNDATERDAGWTSLYVSANAPGVSFAGNYSSRCGSSRPRSHIRHRTGCVHRNGYRRPPPPKTVHQRRANVMREQGTVRIWGGVHFRNTVEVSDQMGRKITEYLLSNSLTPIS